MTPAIPATTEVTAAIEAQQARILADLTELVSYNSVHAEPGCEQANAAAAAWVVRSLEEVGLTVETHLTADGSTAVIGRREAHEGLPTVLLYSHYDVVPAGDPATWTADPFTLTERDGRWYGRGTADCKGNIVMHLAALRALEELGDPGVGITVVIEGSEECGGEGLDGLIGEHPELFTADAIIIADTGNVAEGVPTLTTSLRGGAQVRVTVNTLKSAVHSGGFGGPAPDAVAALIRILDSLRDESGRVAIRGTDNTATWDGIAYDAEAFRADAGVLEGVEIIGDGTDIADQLWARPAVTVTGFTSTPVSEAVNAIPATATAQLNLRTPYGASGSATAEALRNHLIDAAPWGAQVDVEILEVNEPFATDTSGPAAQALADALSKAFGDKETAYCGSGGSIPLTTALQQAVPGAEIALFGVEEPLCTIHSADESVSPEELKRCAVAETLFLLSYTR
ncbi:dipeptidase [Corynebacterium sp. P5848]|uniref:dipeptidase n=1 Tax=Corynebacterium marambiense TaxID=2765364 RepID=UPI002260F249|nr:dipeptidase [Corynebacterium marambiense]MCX7543081.1 dipeptidase [Corynebacterium marambiense]